jgi:hypothetical protein
MFFPACTATTEVAAVVLVFLGGTTWVSGGLWAPDGLYSRFVSPHRPGVGHGRERGALEPAALPLVLDGEAHAGP